jgi:hypothetical protein
MKRKHADGGSPAMPILEIGPGQVIAEGGRRLAGSVRCANIDNDRGLSCALKPPASALWLAEIFEAMLLRLRSPKPDFFFALWK